jgi:iron complex outermembrane receptor protein
MRRFQPNFIHLFAVLLVLLTSFNSSNIFAQTGRGTIKGKITTTRNESASNVSVGLQGTSFGTVTNELGEFSFKAPAGSYKIIISYVGVDRVEVPVNVVAGQTTNVPQISINASLSQLNEVNVIANRSNRFTSRVSNDAAKIPLTQLENSQSYTTVTTELLKEQQVFTVDEALRNVPGVQKMWDATGRAGDGGGYFNLRGFIAQTNLRNGVAGLVTSSIDATNLEKIEVIKGPSATLFGSTLTSFGGLINRVTKKPYDTLGVEVGHTVGSYDLNRTSVDFNTPLTKNKDVLFRLNSAYNYEGSFQSYGKSRTFAVAPSLSIRANDKLSFLFEAEMFYARSSAKPFFFFNSSPKDMGVTNADQLNINYKEAYSNDNITQYSRSTNYFGQANYKISDHLTSQTVFTSSNSFSNGASPYYYLVTDADALAADVRAVDIAGDNNYILRFDQATADSKLNATEIQENLNGDFRIGSVRNRFVIGLDYLHQNSKQLYYSGSYGAAPINDPSFDYGAFNKQLVDATNAASPLTKANTYTYYYKTNTYSAYVSDVVNITDRLIASAGVRVDRYEHEGIFNFDNVQTQKPYNQMAVSPKFGLIYQPIKDALSIFGNYQNGFVNPAPYLNANSETIIPKLQNANQIEGGVKMALFNGKLNGTISYYNIKLTNVIRTLQGAGGAASQSVQDGTQSSKGFETEIIASPFTGFNIVAGFSYNDSKFTKAAPTVEGLRPGTAGSPYLANFYVSYRLPENTIKGLGVGFGGNYASDNKIINATDQGTFSLPSYTLLNSSIFLDRAKYRFGVSVNNLTNKEYYTGYTTVNPQRLRQAVLSATYKL